VAAGRIFTWGAIIDQDQVLADLVMGDLVMGDLVMGAAPLRLPARPITASATTAKLIPAAGYGSRTNEAVPLVCRAKRGVTMAGASGWTAAAGRTLSRDAN
jgi:hypothetical protein